MSAKRTQIENQVYSNSVVPLPDPVDPGRWICVQMMIPDNLGHRAAFLGAISNLATWRVWQRDLAHGGSTAADLWKKARRSVRFVSCDNPLPVPQGTLVDLESLMSDLVQVICDSSGKCILQYRCDVCSPWITVATLDDLQTNPSGANNQPSAGGGSATYCKTLYADQQTIIPTPVNTGDKIEIISANGSWSDGTLRWDCIDGNIFFITCTGTGATTSGSDAVPTAPHMSAVVQFSTGFYPLYPGGNLIVPAGVVNEQPQIIANKPLINTGAGSIDVCVKVTNNQVATYCHNFSNVGDLGNWSPVLDSVTQSVLGHYTPGQGWTANNNAPDDSQIVIKIPQLVGLTITSCTVTMTSPGAIDTSPQLALYQLNSAGTQAGAIIGANTVFSGNSFTWSGLSALIAYGLVLYYNPGNPFTATSRYIISIKVQGTVSGATTPASNC